MIGIWGFIFPVHSPLTVTLSEFRFFMDTSVNIDKIVEDLQKKYTGNVDHDLGVVQEYCRTLPPCEESAKVVAALGKYASEKFADAEAFKIAKLVDEAIKELEKQFNGDPDHDVKVIQDYCQALPKSDENFKVAVTLGQYAAAKFPEAEEVKKSKAEFDKMNADMADIQKRIENIQDMIKSEDIDHAIEELRALLNDVKLPENDESRRLVSFSHPFEEILFSATIKETRPVMRISNLVEMLNLQLGSLLGQTSQYDEAREALGRVLQLNPVSAPANLELANLFIHEKKYQEAFDQLQKAYPLLFSRQLMTFFFYMLAQVVENLDKNYPLAAAYANLSLVYSDNPAGHALLERLAKDHGVDTICPTPEEMQKLAEDANLPIGPHRDIPEIAIQAGRQFKASHPEIAKQFFEIAYELTGRQSILKEMK